MSLYYKNFYRLKLFLSFLIRVRFKTLKIKRKIVIFDCVNSSDLAEVLKNNELFIMSSRIQRIQTIYVSKHIVFFILKNFLKRKIKLNYFIALIKEIKPNVVITTIDNSVEFSLLSKYFLGKVKFLAIQFATRNDIYNNNQNNNQHLYYSNLICFSKFDLELLESKGIKVNNYYFAGSLKNSYFKNFFYNHKNQKKYDICYVCKQMIKKPDNILNQIIKNQIENLKHLARYINGKNLKVIIQSKLEKNLREKKLYEEIFTSSNVDISWRESEKDYLNSYNNISNSKIVLGTPSTLLREALVYDAKVLCCETDPCEEGSHPFSGYNYLGNFNYQQFENKLDEINYISLEEYFKKTHQQKDYYMKSSDTIQVLKNLVEKDNNSLI